MAIVNPDPSPVANLVSRVDQLAWQAEMVKAAFVRQMEQLAEQVAEVRSAVAAIPASRNEPTIRAAIQPKRELVPVASSVRSSSATGSRILHRLNEDMRGHEPSVLYIAGKPIPPDEPKWNWLLKALCAYMYEKSPEHFRKFAARSPRWLSPTGRRRNGNPFTKARAVKEGESMFMEANLSSEDVCKFARDLLGFFSVDPESVRVEWES